MENASKRDPDEAWADAAYRLFALDEMPTFRLELPQERLGMPDVKLEALCDFILAGVDPTPV